MLLPVLPPQAVPVFGAFDYVTVDSQRRRVYAAHGGSKTLLIVDADSGKVTKQIKVGPMAGVAFDPASGHVFTGNGSDQSVSEVDPAGTVLQTVELGAPIDAIAYDAASRRIYADEDNGTRLFVIDAKTMQLVKTVALPGHKPEYLAIDPKTHDVYQNIADAAEIAVIDAATLTVKRTIATPELVSNHPLQYDAAFDQLVVAGTNGVMSAYTSAGTKIGSLAVPRFDQCNLDPAQHVLACAGSGGISRYELRRDATPVLLDRTPVDAGIHTAAIDPATHAVFGVWATRDGSGDYVQKFAPAASP
jgi:DNA-binding beta-propeller fold protein YncE